MDDKRAQSLPEGDNSGRGRSGDSIEGQDPYISPSEALTMLYASG